MNLVCAISFEPVASIVLRYWVAPFGIGYLLDCVLLACSFSRQEARSLLCYQANL